MSTFSKPSEPTWPRNCRRHYEKAALAYNKAVSDAGLAGVRELNRVDASGRPVPKSRAAQFTVTIHGGRD